MLHGVNPLTGILLKMLGLTIESAGRFRDSFLNSDGTRILIYTRNGGGNRESYEEIIKALQEHPQYVDDYDDDFDCTYATFEFNVPEKYLEFTKTISSGENPKSIGEKFKDTIEQLVKENEKI
jgi:hypothetical protein